MADMSPLSPDGAHNRVVALAGATGLVGRAILEGLLADSSVAAVHALGRRAPGVSHLKLNLHVVDFAAPPPLPPLDEVYLALGTTIKAAGSQSAFRAVDFDANLAVARAALAAGARRAGLVSAMGADAKSRVFYNRVKGELEEAVSKLAFDAVNIFRPSLLLGEREEFRAGERIAELPMRYVSFLMVGPLAKYRPVHARAVAAAMLKIAKEQRTGANIFESDQIRRMTDGA